MIKINNLSKTFNTPYGNIEVLKNIDLEIEKGDTAQLPRSLPDLDGAVINTNIILDAKIDPKISNI